MGERETIHASTVAIDGVAVMILGASGAGKSDLALRLIDRGARLVADDYTALDVSGDRLLASAPPTIAGRIEVRGIGIVPCPHVDGVPVALAVRIDPAPVRMPLRATLTFAGVAVRCVALDPHLPSAPIAVELALRHDLP